MRKSIEAEVTNPHRLQAVKGYKILDTGSETAFDELAELARQIFRAPIAIISILDRDREWFKSHLGIATEQTEVEDSIALRCLEAHTHVQIRNLEDDIRFHTTTFHSREPHVKFYAGSPLITGEGHYLGHIAVMDVKANVASETELRSLDAIGRSVMNLLELRKQRCDRLGDTNSVEIVSMCSYCKRVRSSNDNRWSQVESLLYRHLGIRISHGICPQCLEENLLELN